MVVHIDSTAPQYTVNPYCQEGGIELFFVKNITITTNPFIYIDNAIIISVVHVLMSLIQTLH